MNNLRHGLLIALLIITAGFTTHKFYVAIHQINFDRDKKMIQITSRLFIDDINDILARKYGSKTHLGESAESEQDKQLLQKYISEKFLVKVNGKPKALTLVTTEVETNVYICYIKIPDVSKISSLELENKMLVDLVTDQQNIIQTNINGKKESLLLTSETTKGKFKY